MRQILLVEDDPLIALGTTLALEDRGYGVFHAETAEEAVNALEADGFSALVTDINLGPGADGFFVARRWREMHPDAPVVFVSGADAGRYEAEGVRPSELITKPFEPEQVLDFLTRCLH
jgi:DNA-binding response OmpR family regulator